MSDFNKYLAHQEPVHLSNAALHAAAGPRTSNVATRPVCLVTSYRQRSDIPDGTLKVKMAPEVFRRLASQDMHEPVSLSQLPDKWWIADVDISSEDPNFERGGGTVRVTTNTSSIVNHYAFAYCELSHGPFDSRDMADGVCFTSETWNPNEVGPNVRLLKIPSRSAKKLFDRGLGQPTPLSELNERWWVCGVGGGVKTSEEIVKDAENLLHISDGPFDTSDEAMYAFDLLLESQD